MTAACGDSGLPGLDAFPADLAALSRKLRAQFDLALGRIFDAEALLAHAVERPDDEPIGQKAHLPRHADGDAELSEAGRGVAQLLLIARRVPGETETLLGLRRRFLLEQIACGVQQTHHSVEAELRIV